MSDKYRLDPNYVAPEPTGADMFGFLDLTDDQDAVQREMQRQAKWMREEGASQMRVTVVNEEYPNEPYPHGYWFEGWCDANARQLPFGAARPDDGTCSPPLMAIAKEQSA